MNRILKYQLALLFFATEISAIGQDAKYSLVRSKIDSMANEDQRIRNTLVDAMNGKDSLKEMVIRKTMRTTDSLNLIQIKNILKNYGFPGFNEVGNVTTKNFWTLVQHADADVPFQEEALKKMKKEVDRGNAYSVDYAYLVDRIKINKGELQVYGTQMRLNKDSTSYEPNPFIEPKMLNERRKAMGLPSIEDYIKLMNKVYKGKLQKKDH